MDSATAGKELRRIADGVLNISRSPIPFDSAWLANASTILNDIAQDIYPKNTYTVRKGIWDWSVVRQDGVTMALGITSEKDANNFREHYEYMEDAKKG